MATLRRAVIIFVLLTNGVAGGVDANRTDLLSAIIGWQWKINTSPPALAYVYSKPTDSS